MTLPRLSRVAVRFAAASCVLAIAGSACGKSPPKGTVTAPTGKPGADVTKSPAWKKVDQLIDEQKFEEASRAVADIRAAARSAGDETEVVRTLVREVQLRTALGGTETALRFLRDEKWPEQPVARFEVELFYANALLEYLSMYSWEIGQREKVDTQGALDLKKWTRGQIVAEAARAYQELWQRREALGAQPLSLVAEFVDVNNYPAGIRGTLRDALTYFATALLRDSGNWTPTESNDLFQLPLGDLLAGKAQGGAAKLDDGGTHPLARAVAALEDLARFHEAAGRPEAALEARIVRLQALHDHFTEERDRKAVRAALSALLDGNRQLPWWASGQAALAEMVRATGDLVAAHKLADAGRAAFPASPGGQRCASIARDLEAPEVQLASMSSDAAGRRSVLVTHKNLGAVHFRAYAVDLLARIGSADDYNLLPGTDDVRGLLRGKPTAEWKTDLPPTPDYRMHRTFVTPPLTRKGLYVIVASVRPDFADKPLGRVLATHVLVSDLVVVARTDGSGAVQATVVDGERGAPVPGVELMLYQYDYRRRHHKAESHTTDAAGQFTFPVGARDGGFFLVARRGDDLALGGDSIYFQRPWEPGEDDEALVYTDRSIYRPLQTLSWKVVAYRGAQRSGSFHVLEGRDLTVELHDANGQLVDKKDVKTGAFGTAAGSFAIPAGRLLGGWSVQASIGGSAQVRVEEYKRPTFEVTWKDPAGDLRLNQPATLVGEARYYFGLPVTSGSARWRVERETVYPWWWGYYYFAPTRASQVVATGTSKVGKDGTFSVQFTPVADERDATGKGARDISYRYTVSADFTDEGGETRSATRSVRLGFVAVEARLTTADSFFVEGKPAEVTVTRTDLDGKPRAGTGSWRVVALDQPREAVAPSELPRTGRGDSPDGDDGDDSAGSDGPVVTPGDKLRARWETGADALALVHAWPDAKAADRAHGDLTHDAQGVAKLALPSLPAGAWRVRYSTTDAFGAKYETFTDVVVAAARGATPLPVPAVLEAQTSSVTVGGTARFLVGSGLPGQKIFFDVYRQGKLRERRILDGRSPLVEVPITAADRGGFGVVAWLVRDHQPVQIARSVMVPWDDKELSLEFSTFRDTMRPGSKETFRVTVKGPGGKVEAGSAELLAYMFDRSLDYFAAHSPPSVASLYPYNGGTASSRFSLGASGVMWVSGGALAESLSYPTFHGDSLKMFSGYGIGGLGGGGFGRGRMRMMAPGMAPPAPMMAASPAPASAPMAMDMAPARAKKADGAAREEEKPAPPPPPGAKQPATAAPPSGEPVRTNFSETAFFAPQLITDGKGQATIEFTVPDSVTSWNVWVHAITKDLRGGSLVKQARTVKELMVRPYLPRFFREGDQVDLKVVVNNASDHALSGRLRFEIFDPDTNEDLAAAFGLKQGEAAFTADKGGSANLTFAVTAPRRVGQVAVRAVAKAGDFSDGELRPLPLLPGRMHLAQSRFVTLRDKDSRTLKFDDLARGDDNTLVNEKMVVTVDAQLFYTVLKALPYLVEYPYECTEQTMNRFVSTAIVTGVYKDNPVVAKMAAEFGRRDTRLEKWDASDPNRKMALEESPWVREAQGGQSSLPLINVLDPKIAAAQRDEALGKLKKTQTAAGGFPWFPGGPPSPYITLYLMHGFAKASEFGVALGPDDRQMIQRAWQYLARHFREEYVQRLKKKDWGWEFLTFLNYVASSYPDATWTGGALTDAERKEILAFSFEHWKQHSPYLKSLLALTLVRMGRASDGKLVFASIMDSAKTDRDLGTFWAQEDRSWLWYNDSTETHAFALRALMEVTPDDDKRKDGLVLWLLLDKKLSHWKSTRATAEVIYALVKYMQKAGTLGVREEIRVKAPPVDETLVFEPDHYVGKSQIVIPGDKIDAKTTSTITVEKSTKGFAFASATWHFSTEKLPAEARGDFFGVTRTYYKRDTSGSEARLLPLAEGAKLAVGDEVEVQVSLRSKHAAEYVHLRDPRPAGFEPATTVSQWKWDLGISWYEEVRDSGENFFFEWLPVGEYTFKYRLRATLGGTFKVSPATVQAMYAPEFVAYSAGNVVGIAAGN